MEPQISATKTRKNWIDWMRAFGMLLIVWGHTFPTDVTPFIYSFNVPLFFIVSGFLFKQEASFGTMLKKNWHSLILPYLLLCLIKDFSHFIKHYDDFNELILTPLGILSGFHTFFDAPAAKNLWFVYTLILLKVIFQLVGNKNINFIVTLLLSFVGIYICHIYNYHPMWAVTNTFLALPFFMLGYLISSKNYTTILDNVVAYVKSKNNVLIGVIFVLLIILQFFVSRYNGDAWMFCGEFGNNIVLFFILAIIGTFAIFLISAMLDNIRYKFVSLISVGSLVILEFHRDLYHPIGKLLKQYYTGVVDEALLTLAGSIIVVLAFVPITMLLQKIFPIILGKRKI